MTTVEQSHTQHAEAAEHTEAAEIMPFGGWENTPAGAGLADHEVLFRFPAIDDPAPSTTRLLVMSLYAAVLGLTGIVVGVLGLIKVIGGAGPWYLPLFALFGMLSLGAAVGSFLSIHRPLLPWLLLAVASVPLVADMVLTALQ